jgi:tripartite-type tricarboxylate transporter receptor subunit TctC
MPKSSRGGAFALSLMGAFALGCFAAPPRAAAQTFPDHPVHIIVNFGAGGSADTLARLVGQELQNRLGQTFIVENKTGAGGNIGADFVAHASPDGYTLLVTPNSFALAPAFYTKLSYDPVKSFAPVTLFGFIPDVIVVHPSMPVKTLAELVALAKSKPGEISYASAGYGSGNHLRTELLKSLAGIDLVHVPYRANPIAEIDVIAGRVPVMFDLLLTALSHVKQGELRALATTSDKRSALLPEVPTSVEAGYPDLVSGTWFAAYAPANTPKPIVEKLNAEITAVLKSPAMAERLAGLGVEVTPGGPEELGRLTRDDFIKWAPVVTKAGIKPE